MQHSSAMHVKLVTMLLQQEAKDKNRRHGPGDGSTQVSKKLAVTKPAQGPNKGKKPFSFKKTSPIYCYKTRWCKDFWLSLSQKATRKWRP